MLDSPVIETVVGLSFLYLLLSLMCSTLSEWIARVWALRARGLESAIRSLLVDSKLAEHFYTTHILQSLQQSAGARPSYITPRLFATTLFEIVAPVEGAAPTTIATVRSKIAASGTLPEGLKKTLLTLVDQGQGDLDRARDAVENWFRDAMDRLSGWYKRQAQLVILGLAAIVTIGLNVNTVLVGERLLQDAKLRSSIAGMARDYATSHRAEPVAKPTTEAEARERIKAVAGDIFALGLPIGWASPPWERGWPSMLVGWLITIGAVSLGAPFWFDVLNKVSNLRATGKKPNND